MSAESQPLRPGQQRRTRAALLTAAAKLIGMGTMPSVAEAAEAADVSRRTAYRYFPTQEQLLTEAALETLRSSVEAAFTSIESAPEERIEAAVRAMQAEAVKNERLLRTMIRLTIERGADDAAAGRAKLRGSRRIDWLESALEPTRKKLGPVAFDRLLAAISLCVGAEALIVLRDVVGLPQDRAIDVSVWSARALVKSALAAAKSTSR